MAVRLARERGLRAIAISFDPHPASVVRGDRVRLISTVARRRARLEALGAEVSLVRFDEARMSQSAEDFTRETLIGGMGVAVLVLGHDSRFGHGRRGDAALARRIGLEVVEVPPVLLGAGPVSSRRIREALGAGDLQDAEACLGGPWVIEGRVVRGEGRGRGLGFPTANLDVGDLLLPKAGVYAGRTAFGPAAVNVGVRPTVGGAGALLAEVHVIGWEGDLYGRELAVEMTTRLRDERRFDSLEDLRSQIARDVAEAGKLA